MSSTHNSINSAERSSSSYRKCGACKYLRRRCSQDQCILSPYFPPSHPHRFACVHRVFGARNVARMLQHLPAHQRAEAADSISAEAYWRVEDPVHGSAGIVTRLQQDIYTHQRELEQTHVQIAMYTANQDHLHQAHQSVVDGTIRDRVCNVPHK